MVGTAFGDALVSKAGWFYYRPETDLDYLNWYFKKDNEFAARILCADSIGEMLEVIEELQADFEYVTPPQSSSGLHAEYKNALVQYKGVLKGSASYEEKLLRLGRQAREHGSKVWEIRSAYYEEERELFDEVERASKERGSE